MTDELPPLPDELTALLQRAGAPQPPPGFADQVLARIDLAPLSAAATAASAASAARGLAGAKLAVALVTVAGLGAAGGVALDRLAFPVAPTVLVKEVRVEVPVPVLVPQLPQPAVAPPLPAKPPASAAPREPAATPQPSVAEVDAQLKKERALLEVARTALARNDGAAALRQLESHAREFPHGRLAEERDALWVTTLDSLGQREEARRRARAFLTDFPDSILAPQVKRVLP